MFFNQHSYLFGSAFLLALVGALSLRGGINRAGLIALSVTFAALLVGWLTTRTGPSTFAQIDEVEAALSGGQPTLIEFYSNY